VLHEISGYLGEPLFRGNQVVLPLKLLLQPLLDINIVGLQLYNVPIDSDKDFKI